MHRAFKAKYRHSSKDALNSLGIASFSQAAAKAAFSFALFILATHKRVNVLLRADLLTHCIVLQLIAYEFCNLNKP